MTIPLQGHGASGDNSSFPFHPIKDFCMRVTAYIRQKDAAKNDLTSRATVYFRVRDKGLDIKCASELQINPNHWSQERQGYKSRVALVDTLKRQSRPSFPLKRSMLTSVVAM